MTPREPSRTEASDRIASAMAILDEHDTLTLAACADDEPWIARLFYVGDEPASGRFDLCCCVLATPARHDLLAKHARVAFLVAGDEPDRWISGVGTAEFIEDDAEADAVRKRLAEKAPSAGPFLDAIDSAAVRIHVERLRVTDRGAEPPVAEFTFA